MKRNPEKQIALSRETLAPVLGAYGIADFAFAPIEEGIENTSARVASGGRRYVLRAYAEGKRDPEILLEVALQDFLRDRGIPIPAIIPNANGEKLTVVQVGGRRVQAILMDFVEGESVTSDPSPALLGELAGIQARMHALGIEFAETMERPESPLTELREEAAEKLTDVPVGGADVREAFKRIAAYRYPLDPRLSYGYNHLDIDFDGNVIVEGGHVKGIVDFDDVRYSPAVVCLGYTLWNILDDQGEGMMRRYLAAYEAVRPLAAAERDALPNVLFFRNYMMIAVRLLLWNDATPIGDVTSLLKLERDIPKLPF